MNVFQHVCDIIQTEMALLTGQVYLFNEKFDIPTDQRLYIAVGVGATKPIGVSSKFDPSTNEEIQYGSFHTTLQIEVLSRNDAALTRKEEVLMAFKSNYSRNKQIQYGFGIFPQGRFINASSVEGGAIPYRFSLNVTLQYQISKSKATDYYDDFGYGFDVKTEN